ncbi:MAG: hypothetical protein ABIZ49_01245 [Opitutaceae bacterium]
MTRGHRPLLKRAILLPALALIALALSGCVYLRLLELKRQFEQFDRHFRLQTDNGLRIVCETPVLLTADVRWIGLKPESTKRIGQAEQWQVRWVKQTAPEVKEAAIFDIVIELTFAGDKLTRVAIPEHYFALMPKAFLVDVLKSLGGGRVDKSGRKIEADVSAATVQAARPSLPDIDKLLGRPTEERIEGKETMVRYVYAPATKESRAGTFDMTLHFDTASGELLRWLGRTPIGKIGFNFAATPARP